MNMTAPLAAIIVLPALTFAQVPDYGLEWKTIGAAGNRPIGADLPDASEEARSRGAVSYEFRLTTTELTQGQWLEFVRAYAPYWTGATNDSRFTGEAIYLDVNGVYQVYERFRNIPVAVTWEMAARYCNWLCNDKRPDRAAFESGAYDTSTFYFTADQFGYNSLSHHQPARSRGAAYWIPGLDEMIKANFYDPNRFGAGNGGYWLYNQGSDAVPIAGRPGVGTTNTGLGVNYADVGQYPDFASPWGLLDTSGGLAEWTETQFMEGSRNRCTLGSSYGTDPAFIFFLDGLLFPAEKFATADVRGLSGLRIASNVPSVHVLNVTGLALILSCSPRRRGKTNGLVRAIYILDRL